MPHKFYTLIIVPHAKAKFRKVQVSVRLAKWVGGLGAVLTLVVAGILAHYTWITAEVHELRHLKAENADLLVKTRAYEQDAAKLQSKVANLQSFVNKLGVMAGLEQTLPDPRVGGVGGVPSAESVAPSVNPVM